MKKVFEIDVKCTGLQSVKSSKGQINIISFTGSCHSDFFDGIITQGGADTQKYISGLPGNLSARYILDGTDKNNVPTKIFIENNGTIDEHGTVITKPFIMSDNPSLSFLEDMDLTGRISDKENPGEIAITFFKN